MIKILFVCAGNTCRSPMAEVILRQKGKDKGVELEVSSAGEYADDGKEMNEKSKFALKLSGYSGFEDFRSKKATFDVKKDGGTLIYMEKFEAFRNKHWHARSMSLYSDGQDVLDPYGMSQDEYIKTCKQIENACDKIIELIQKGEF